MTAYDIIIPILGAASIVGLVTASLQMSKALKDGKVRVVGIVKGKKDERLS
jgi:hypothetical protein